MPNYCRFALTISLLLLLSDGGYTVLAQSSTNPNRPPIVTATASTERVRYLAAGEVNHTRLQVFSADGSQVYDSNFRLGNLVDWQLVDHQGTALVDGSYLFLVTVKDFSNQLTQKYGTAILEEGQVYLEQTPRAELASPLSTALEANAQADSLSVVDRIGAAGLNRTASSTTTPGIASTSVTSTGETDATGGDKDIGGAGTQNQIAKWIDNAGNLGDSIITESGGNIGIDTLSPTQKLHVATGNLQIGSGTNSHSMLLNYTGTGGGGDITAMMNGVEMLSFGFNNTGQLGGTAGTPSGRILYFYDRVAAQYRGGFNSSGEWYWGPTTGNYGLKVVQPNVGVTGLTVEANGNVGIGTVTPSSKLTVNGVVESTSGGVKFPDATTQTTAFTVPLSLTSSVATQTFISTNTGSGHAVYGINTGTGRAGYFQINNTTNPSNALFAETNGTGRAGFFGIGNASNPSPALFASTNGSGIAVQGFNSGTGTAGAFHINNASNSSNALFAQTNGTGSAGNFSISNATNSSPALSVTTNGTERAGAFQISNASNSSFALHATTNGSGIAFVGSTNGTGNAGNFAISNASNSSIALFATTIGTGRAGNFQISNSLNPSNALFAQTNGSGNAVQSFNSGTGRAGLFEINNTANTNTALVAVTNGTGRVGLFQIDNAGNSSPALFALTNGTGSAIKGENTSTGLAGEFSGKVDVNNARLLVSTDAGGSATITVGERYRDNALIAWGYVPGTGISVTTQRFGIATVVKDSTGVYTITLNSAPTDWMVPLAVAEVDNPPTTAAAARIVVVNRVNNTSFKVYILNGNYAAVDNDFNFMVTGR